MADTREHDLDISDLEGEPPQSPLETFILGEVEPRRNELNEWESRRSHIAILLHTAQGRRLHAKKIGGKDSLSFALSRSGVQLGGIDGAVTTLVSHHALRATKSLELARQCLVLSEVPHLTARTFPVSQYKSAAAFANDIGHAVSVKPTAEGAQGGATANLDTLDDFNAAWERAVVACTHLPAPKRQVDVSVFLPWISLRVFVVGERVVAAVGRIPLYIVGDGTNTVQQLARHELQRRNACKYLAPVSDHTAGEIMNALPGGGGTLERGRLHVLSFDQKGQDGAGWSVDVTHRISSELATLAINATWAFPGLGASAVDILAPSLNSGDEAVVTNLDPAANLREFRYPAYGQPRHPNLEIMNRIAARERK